MQHFYFFILLRDIAHFIVSWKGNAEACVSAERGNIIFTDFSNEMMESERGLLLMPSVPPPSHNHVPSIFPK